MVIKKMTIKEQLEQKDRIIKTLVADNIEAREVAKIALDSWKESIDTWGFHIKIDRALMFAWFLMGIAWGIIIFA